jgi:leucyl-tRNA synthetase
LLADSFLATKIYGNTKVPRYNPSEIEPRWQRYWDEHKTFKTPEEITGEKLYALDMFPYPSGEGLHVGHPEGYTATDIIARHARMAGKSVLHPMGFDAFGLPAEEHAIKTNTPPRIKTEENIATFTRQLKELGFSYDWDRKLSTTDIGYVKWTQWIFLVLFDTWFDPEKEIGRPISELPIPDDVSAEGELAVESYRDEFRLAYQSDAPVNWCPALGTVLANEEVVNGLSEVGNHPVERRPLRQWMLRITAYADRLERELEPLDWPEGIKKLQRDWIGRSTGAEVDFFIGPKEEYDSWKSAQSSNGFSRKPADNVLRVYTTRPDTLFGATYMVIAPEHPAVKSLTTDEQSAAVEKYCTAASMKSDRDRQDDKQTKTGVFTGSYAINPIDGQPVPVWIADYVLISYGTGAIMAVPAHDERDFQFAKKFEIPIIAVVEPPKSADVDAAEVVAGNTCFAGHGQAINSGKYDGLATGEFKEKIIADLSASGVGREAVNYKLRDWLFSRQRFWGEPFPILHEVDGDGNKTGRIRPVPATTLPVELPELEDFKPHGRPEPPLEKADDDWLYPVIDGVRYKRETNTMPQWAGSCWYFLRFIDPHNDDRFIDPELEKQWMPVDLYIGGAEHAVLHLLYSRFWHKVLFDRGYVHSCEPFHKLVNQGMILGENEFTGYRDSEEQWISAADVKENEEHKPVMKKTGQLVQAISLQPDQVVKSDDGFVLASQPEIRIDGKAYKMSKSRGNVINPDAVVADFGADSLRLYEMFMGPLEQSKPWSMSGVSGVRGFLDRSWRMIVDEVNEEFVINPAIGDHEATEEQTRVLHKTIKAISEDIAKLSFNTSIARMMEFVNFFTKQTQRPKPIMESFVLLLSPFAPHIAEELWKILGHDQSLAYEAWPAFDESLTVESSLEIPVQINGKNRAKIQIERGATTDQLISLAKAEPRIQELLQGKTVRKEIAVPDRLVNIVAN